MLVLFVHLDQWGHTKDAMWRWFSCTLPAMEWDEGSPKDCQTRNYETGRVEGGWMGSGFEVQGPGLRKPQDVYDFIQARKSK